MQHSTDAPYNPVADPLVNTTRTVTHVFDDDTCVVELRAIVRAHLCVWGGVGCPVSPVRCWVAYLLVYCSVGRMVFVFVWW